MARNVKVRASVRETRIVVYCHSGQHYFAALGDGERLAQCLHTVEYSCSRSAGYVHASVVHGERVAFGIVAGLAHSECYCTCCRAVGYLEFESGTLLYIIGKQFGVAFHCRVAGVYNACVPVKEETFSVFLNNLLREGNHLIIRCRFSCIRA